MKTFAPAAAVICMLVVQGVFGAVNPATLQKGAENLLSYTAPDGKVLSYQLYVPAAYTPSAKIPLYVWMHGGGTVTPPLDTNYSAMHMLKINPKWSETTYPCIVFEPFCAPGWCTKAAQTTFTTGQCWDGYGWANGTPAHVHDLNNPPVALALICAFIPILEKDLGLDSSRCYALGWSNGGYATWDLLMLHPELFAAGVPISGAGDTSHASRFVNIPVWAFHSGDDDVIPYSGTQTMIDKLTALGGKPKLTNTNGWKHFAYAPTFQTADLLPWLFSQSKSGTSTTMNRFQAAPSSLGGIRAQRIVGPYGMLFSRSAQRLKTVGLYNVKGELIGRGLVGVDGMVKPQEPSRSSRAR
jgi:hypothetical protein